MQMCVTVGPSEGDFVGANDLAIQAAVEYVAARGGGTVRLRPGTYSMGNSVRLRRGVRLVGAGADTLLRKEPSATVPLTEDTDWYEARVTVADARPFRVGGGIMLNGRCPHYGSPQVTISTVRAIDGQTLWLDTMARGLDAPAHIGNYWLGHEATASTLYSLVTANWAEDLYVADLRLDGNREQSASLNGNYGAAMYFQDCQHVRIERVQVGNMHSDGLSFQIVHDLTVQDCVFDGLEQGIHPGSGSQRPVIRNNTVRQCSRHGLSWCWGVKHGVAEDNRIEDCQVGCSIGHRDTDNVMRRNSIRNCAVGGLVFRDDPPEQAAHDNLIEHNLIQDVGSAEEPGYGIDLNAAASGTVLRRNRVVCTRPGTMRAGIRIGAKVQALTLDGNTAEGLAALEDLRSS